METERIDIDGGDYAIVLKELIHKTSRKVQEYYRKFMKPIEVPLSDIQTGKVNPFSNTVLDWNSVDGEEVTDIFILNQVIEWSFGEVNKENIDSMSESKRQKLTGRLNEMYQSPFVPTNQKD